MMLFRQSPAVLSRRVGPEVVLAAPDRTDFERLSETAASVWELLESPRTISDVIETLAPLYGMPAPAIAPDVESLMRHLLARGVIEEVPGTDG